MCTLSSSFVGSTYTYYRWYVYGGAHAAEDGRRCGCGCVLFFLLTVAALNFPGNNAI